MNLIAISFFAGILTFFSSCTFILIPPFLGLVGGSASGPARLNSYSGGQDQKNKDNRSKILNNAIFYVIGFSAVFTLLGFGVGLATQFFSLQEWINKAGGVILIFMGLFTAGFLKPRFLLKESSFKIPKFFIEPSKVNSFLLGGIFAFGWSPCTGPFLGSLLILAGYSGTAAKGAILLFIFSLGITLPFIFMALSWGQLNRFFKGSETTTKVISVTSGLFLITIGVLLVIGKLYAVVGIYTYFFS